jgi:signal transduction histidine kinase/ligand-binding sensor domain-containing protein
MFTGSFPISAQPSITSPNKHFLFKNYTTQNGLLDNTIYLMKHDKNGYIWITSESGLTRFDGKTFYYEAIPEIYDNSAPGGFLENTVEGNIIAAGWGQGVFVQQNNRQFKRYTAKDNTWSTLKSCPDGRILAASSDILYLLTPDSLKQLYDFGSKGLFKTIDIDKENRIWFGSERFGLGILQLSGTGYEPVFLPEFKDKMINYILFDDEGTLHVATYSGYYRIKWRQFSQWNNYTIEQPFPQLKDIKINCIYIDNERNLWIPTSSYGVFRTKGDTVTLHLTKENGLIYSGVMGVIQDREGNYWFGTFNGLSMIDNFDNYAIAQNGVRFIDACGMLLDEYNRIWLFCSSPLSIFQDEKLITINLNGTPIEKEGAWFVNIFNSELIIANNAGLYKMPLTKALPDLRKLRKIVDFKANNVTDVFRMVTDSAGIWIYTQTKVYNYRDGRFLPVTFKPDSILVRPCLMIPDKYGFYWYGDNRTGLYRGVLSRPDNHTLLFESKKYYRPRKADADFETEFIDYMYFDKEGNLWLSASFTGVYKFDIDCNGVVSYKLYTTADGLLSDLVKGIDCDDKGRVWFSTRKGINILQYDSAGNETIDKLDIIKKIDDWYSSMPIEMGDRLFFLTQEGVFITHNQWFKEKSIKVPKVFITNLLINGVADSEISANTNKIRLTHGQNNLTIDFSSITFKNADEVMYQYKLEGTNEDWSVLSDRGFVEYASLRSGKYTFKVRAVIGDVFGEETTLTFRIASAYYQTVWFYLLIVIVIFALLYAFHKYRLRQALKVELMRARIASDLHDDVGSTLSSISMLSEMAKKQDKEEMLAKALSRIGENSRDMLNSMDDIIWSVNPQNDSLHNLLVRLREFAIPVCEAKNMTLNLNVGADIHSMKLEMDERRNVYLIAKEAINNAAKHSGCESLSVTFAYIHQLEISIKDDGCGFDTTLSTARNGLANMERRAKQIGAEFIIKSEKKSGTTVLLKIRNT